MIIRFAKYEGAGNDFILLDTRADGVTPSAELIRALCDRHKGVGADGLMTLGHSEQPTADFRMRYYNADGLEGTMCGNGGRCITLFAHQLGIGAEVKCFEGIDGLHTARMVECDGEKGIIELGMIDVEAINQVEGDYLLYTGSNHVVRIVEDLDRYDVDGIGKSIRYNPLFDYLNGVNVNFVKPKEDGTFRIRTYERGVENETLACGTGAVASAIAVRHYTSSDCNKWSVEAQGGKLNVQFEYRDSRFEDIRLTGPARRAFVGEFDTDNM